MSRYLTFVAAHTHTRGNDLLAYLVLAVAVCALPGAVLFFVLLSIIAAVVAVASAVATAASYTRDGLGSLLYAGRVLLADRLHIIADGIDPRGDTAADGEPEPPAQLTVAVPVAVAEPAPVEAPAPEPVPVPEPLPLPLPVPVAMPAAAQITTEEPPAAAHSTTADEADTLRAALAEHGSIRGAAKALGMADSTLRGRLKRLGIEAPTAKGKQGRKVEATADVAA